MTAEDRIEALEWRLQEYHSWLADAIDERDRHALLAAWSVNGAYQSTTAMALAILAVHYWLGDTGWLSGALIAVALFVIPSAVLVWNNDRHAADEKKLSKLPEWKPPTAS